jgi:hypothetical protein
MPYFVTEYTVTPTATAGNGRIIAEVYDRHDAQTIAAAMARHLNDADHRTVAEVTAREWTGIPFHALPTDTLPRVNQ